MASGSRAEDVQVALQRAKKKISNLQQQLSNKETSAESPVETSLSTWTPSKELRDSLVDMYTANPRVNVELRQRLPSPAAPPLSLPDRSGISVDHTDWPPGPQHLQESLTSCCLSPATHRSPLGGVGGMEMDVPPSRGPSPRVESRGDAPDGGRSSRGPGSPALRRQPLSADASSHPDITSGPITASAAGHTFDRDKNISFLLKELDVLRDINKKLRDQLVQKEKELQKREVEEELGEEQREARSWERPAAVLDELLAAQKDRDQALMSRLLLANEERDEALLRARQLQQASELDVIQLDDADTDVDELLRGVCDADLVQDVDRFGSALVQRLRLARQRRNDITAQEMKAVMEERDGSVAKLKQLEQNLTWEREQREKLLRLQTERGGASEVAESQALQTNHSSQDLLPAPPDDVISQAPPLLVQVQQLWKEKQSVEAELQRCQEAEREASERARRLERLVEVLRKKVGTGSVRAVI